MLCKKCYQDKGPDGFYPSDPNWCKECRKEYSRINRYKYRDRDRAYCKDYWKKNKEELYRKQSNERVKRYAEIGKIKEASPCMDCKNFYPAICMDFDHLDPTKKIADVSKLVNNKRPWDEIMKEIAKCDLVCANCHRLRTQSRVLTVND